MTQDGMGPISLSGGLVHVPSDCLLQLWVPVAHWQELWRLQRWALTAATFPVAGGVSCSTNLSSPHPHALHRSL